MATAPPERRKSARANDPELRGRRSEPRAYLVLPASAEALSGHLRVRILDVARTGARLAGTDLPETGKEIFLRCGSIDAFGTIAWRDSGQCGIRFDEALSLKQLVAVRALAAEIADGATGVDEREAADDWANGLAR